MTFPSRKAVATALAIASLIPMAAFAQTTVGTSVTAVGNAGQMPVFYSSTGTAVNNSTSAPLPAGYYYLAPGAQHQIYYYGNGTYYDPSTGEYGGSVNNPNGTAGASLYNGGVAQNTSGTSGTTGTTGTGTTGTGSSTGTYNSATGTYSNTGTTGTGSGTTGTSNAPGVPNTGAGGDSLAAWMTLAISAAVIALGAGYLASNRRNALN